MADRIKIKYNTIGLEPINLRATLCNAILPYAISYNKILRSYCMLIVVLRIGKEKD